MLPTLDSLRTARGRSSLLPGCGSARIAREVELTAKHADRIAQIMTGMAGPDGYPRVIYLTAGPARGVVTRCAEALPPGTPGQVTVWDLPPTASAPETSRR